MFRYPIDFLISLYKSRQLIFRLAVNDFKVKYLGSMLGISWAFLQPTLTIMIFWFVFQVGFKNAPVDNFPFILWLICGMIPWFFFNDALINATSSILDNAYLVKKVVFRVGILPFVKITSALFIHIFFIAVIFIMFMLYGYSPTAYSLQAFYYTFAMCMLLLGLVWLTASIVVFLKDIAQVIAVFLQFAFWLTPIFYPIKIVPAKFQFILKMNPILYIVEGYRDAFINHIWFWDHYNQTIYFWIVTVFFLVIGGTIFRKLRPHFADVL